MISENILSCLHQLKDIYIYIYTSMDLVDSKMVCGSDKPDSQKHTIPSWPWTASLFGKFVIKEFQSIRVLCYLNLHYLVV